MSPHRSSQADRRAADDTRPPASTTLLGLPFINEASIARVADYCFKQALIRSPDWRCVVTPNVDHVVHYDAEPETRAVAESAWLVLPDGMPIVWASRLLGGRLRARLTGADLFAELYPQLVANSVPTVVVASSDPVASALRASGGDVHLLVPPRFAADDEPALERVIDDIDSTCRAADAAVCVIGVSMDKHHRIAAGLRRRWNGEGDAYSRQPIVLLLGGAADMYVGAVRRSPAWMQRLGLEWLYRLATNPRRLARRYLVDDPVFVLIVARELIRRTRASWRDRNTG